MNQLNEQQLRTHVPVAGWLLIANSVLGLVVGLVLFILMVLAGSFFAGLAPVANDPEATRIFSLITGLNTLMAAVISGFLALLSVPGLIAGAGMLARKSWGRILGIVVSAFSVLNFPVGTLIGAYGLFVLMQEAATTYFASPPPSVRAAPQPA